MNFIRAEPADENLPITRLLDRIRRLAFLDPDEQDDYLAGPLAKLTKATPTNKAALRKELAEIRARGYARSEGERLDGAGSVAAPILGHDGRPIAVISVCGPAERFRAEAPRASKLLVEATKRVSHQLGFRS
jgi:DNA-binding IclR family transcriptional regulator